ncbi:MAG: glycosyltransferase family 39 protein [Fibrobacteraceae bacterium]|nr:glycosyltransferase family 39 protein [Fibrobacteraceae bacterium]
MKRKIISILPVAVVLILLVVGIIVFNLSNVEVRHFHMVRNGLIENINFPIRQDFGIEEVFSVEFDLVSSSKEVSMRIIPDDCVDAIIVDGKRKSLAGIKGLCSFGKGFDFTAEPGHYQVYLRNKGGVGGFDMVLKKVFIQDVLYVVNTLLFLVLLGLLLYRFKVLPLHIILLLLVAVGLHSAYTGNTNYMTRSYDTDGHLDYVKYVATNYSVPKNDQCWSCYHPPVYYALGASVWNIAPKLGLVETRALQWLSFALSVALMIVGAKILALILQGAPLVLSSLLWLFWPILFMISPRIGNDQLFFLTHTLCLWGCFKYVVDKNSRYMILAAIMVALSFWTKSTGAVTALIFASALVLGYFPRQSLKPNKSEVVAVGIFILFAISVVGIKLLSGNALVGNLNSLNSAMRVEANLQNFLFFDFKDFLTVPYTSGWEDVGGRQYMLNYLAKSSMFGETILENSITGRNLAIAMSFMLLVLVAISFIGFLKTKMNKAYLLLLLQIVFFFAALVSLRISAPYGCSSDFRYVVPMLLSFVPFVSFGILRKEVTLGWKCFGVGVSVLFVVCTVWLMMLL